MPKVFIHFATALFAIYGKLQLSNNVVVHWSSKPNSSTNRLTKGSEWEAWVVCLTFHDGYILLFLYHAVKRIKNWRGRNWFENFKFGNTENKNHYFNKNNNSPCLMFKRKSSSRNDPTGFNNGQEANLRQPAQIKIYLN